MTAAPDHRSAAESPMFARCARGTKSLGAAALNPLGVTRNDQAGEPAQAP